MIRKIEFEYLRWKAANIGRGSSSFSVVCLAEEIIVEYNYCSFEILSIWTFSSYSLCKFE